MLHIYKASSHILMSLSLCNTWRNTRTRATSTRSFPSLILPLKLLAINLLMEYIKVYLLNLTKLQAYLANTMLYLYDFKLSQGHTILSFHRDKKKK
jgi:hypothetical protein